MLITTSIPAPPQEHLPTATPVSPEVDCLLSRMTLDEKIGQLNLLTPGEEAITGPTINTDIESKVAAGRVGGLFGITDRRKIRHYQQVAIEQSRLGVPLLIGADIIHGYKMPTFPIPLGLACSWDMELIEGLARAAAEQASADGINWNFSPMLDVCRDPRWGRVMESYGEDPYYAGRVASAVVRGYQGTDLAQPGTLMACPKHFAGTGYADGGRDYEFVDVSPLVLHEVILPPFVAAIKAGAGSIMAAFNDMGGQPCHANRELLTGLLRRKLLFDGMVCADYNGVPELEQHGLGNGPTVAARALTAGVDMDMAGESYSANLHRCLDAGMVRVDDVDRACRRVLAAKSRLGLLDDPWRGMTEDRRVAVAARTPEYRLKARSAAARSCVLLKNDGGLLPLSKTAGTIAVIGPLADSASEMYGNWAQTSDGTPCISILDGIRNAAGSSATVLHARGGNICDDPTIARRMGCLDRFDHRPPAISRDEALRVARQADVIVIVAGEAKGASGEHSSVTDLRLPPPQRALIEAALQTHKPVALVVVSGRPLDLSWEDTNVGAILWAPFGGTEAGNGVADVLTGRYNPSGKLPVTFPRNVGQVPIYYARRRSGRPLDQSRPLDLTSYVDSPSTELYPFGHGLGYSPFRYGPVRLSKCLLKGNETLKASVMVANIGDRDGEETALLFVRPVTASRTQPVQLRGMQKTLLRAGESRDFEFEIRQDDLSFPVGRTVDDTGRAWEAGEFEILIGPNARACIKALVSWEAGFLE